MNISPEFVIGVVVAWAGAQVGWALLVERRLARIITVVDRLNDQVEPIAHALGYAKTRAKDRGRNDD